ncbi:MAG: hypothetical protein M1834_007984 [Cirrosporium novae-zelandiae]|nr:MAG: hypothetical protein M1834_007984 [Cirrosporium novae-zelandiae]
MDIKTVDFIGFKDGSASQRQVIGEAVTEAFRKNGFLKLTNHGISRKTLDGLFNWSEKFFSLPVEVKQKAPHPSSPTPNRGYSAVGMENTSIHGLAGKGVEDEKNILVDMKECFDQGAVDDELYQNIWLPESDLPGFRAFMESYFDICFAVQLQIMQALAIGLGLPEDTFDKLHDRHENELRLTHYPEIEAGELLEGSKTRISEHTDFGTITLLFQDSVGGLEVECPDKPGHFEPIESDKVEMIANIGDCLQRWTNDQLHSTRHRVHISQRDLKAGTKILPSRYSIAFFAKPNRKSSLQPFAELVEPGQEPKYGNMTAGEFIIQRSSTTY